MFFVAMSGHDPITWWIWQDEAGTCRIPTLYVSSYFGVRFCSVLSQGLVSTGGWKKRTFFVYQSLELVQTCIVHTKLDIYVFINFHIFYLPLSSRTPCVHCLFISSVMFTVWIFKILAFSKIIFNCLIYL